MAKEQTGEQKSTKDKALDLVNKEIAEVEKCLEYIAKTEDAPLIMVDGKTSKGFDASAWVKPQPIAKIMLKYDHYRLRVLGLDTPDAMWNEIAKFVGLSEVYFVDIPLCSAADKITNTKTD